MTSEPGHCLNREALGRAFTEGADDALERHVASCTRCRREWQVLGDLQNAARAIRPPPLSAQRHERVEAAIMQRLEREERRGPARRSLRRLVAAAVVLSAAAATVLLLRPPPLGPEGGSEGGERYRAQLFERPGTQARRAAAQPDEQVRLTEGTLGVEVTPLTEGERFRVMLGDAEVEVVGTAFEVVAQDDRLESVLVWTGVVEVRVEGSDPVRLRQGERWLSPRARRAAPTAQTAALGEASPAEVLPPLPEPPEVETPPAPDVAAPQVVPPELSPALDELAPAAPAKVRSPGGEGERTEVRRARRGPRAAVEPAADAVEEADEAPEGDGVDGEAVPDPAAALLGESGFRAGFDALRGGDPARAAELLAQVPPGAPLAEDAAYWRGVALARAGRGHAAADALADFLRRYPSSRRQGEAAVALGWILQGRGDRARARFWFESAAEAAQPRVRDSALRGLKAVGADEEQPDR